MRKMEHNRLDRLTKCKDMMMVVSGEEVRIIIKVSIFNQIDLVQHAIVSEDTEALSHHNPIVLVIRCVIATDHISLNIYFFPLVKAFLFFSLDKMRLSQLSNRFETSPEIFRQVFFFNFDFKCFDFILPDFHKFNFLGLFSFVLPSLFQLLLFNLFCKPISFVKHYCLHVDPEPCSRS